MSASLLPIHVGAGNRWIDHKLQWTAAVTGSLFLVLAALVFGGSGIQNVDVAIVGWLQAIRTPIMFEAMAWVSKLHESLPVAAYVALLAIAGYLTERKRWANILIATVPGGMILNAAVKLIFHRPRPSFLTTHTISGSFSFPSGHVSAATLLYGFVIWFAFANFQETWKRVAVGVFGVLMIFLVAASRMYLTVHYLSDVLASMLLGSTVLLLVAHYSRNYLKIRD